MNPGLLATGGWLASAVAAAAALGIADLLEQGPRRAGDLAEATGTSAPVLTQVLRALAHVGVFQEDADGRFSNTADSELLRSSHPHSQRHFVQLAAGDYQRVMLALAHALRTGEPATGPALGGTLYEYLERSPAAADIYDRAMDELARPVADAIAAGRDFSRARLIVDVGGGRGALVKAILRRYPDARGICADRGSVAARASAALEREEPDLAPRLAFAATDFFREVPAGGDVYLLKNVLHNWNDESAVGILRTIRAAMTRDARLLVIEPVGMPPRYEAADALVKTILGERGTVTRSAADLRRLASASGLREISAYVPDSGFAVIEAGVDAG